MILSPRVVRQINCVDGHAQGHGLTSIDSVRALDAETRGAPIETNNLQHRTTVNVCDSSKVSNALPPPALPDQGRTT